MQRVENGIVSQISNLNANVIVVGGGLAGVCAAIAAARQGATVILIQERPVLGGNSSSEIRVGPSGATGNGYHRDARETGIIEELFLETRSRSFGLRQVNGNHYPMWDVVLEEKVRSEPNIRLLLNTRVIEIETEGDVTDGYVNRITGLKAVQQGTEATFHVSGEMVVDATGDGFIALQAGTPYRYGREAASEYGESWAPEAEDTTVLGSTIMFAARDVGRPVPFTPPAWASEFHSEDSLPYRSHEQLDSGYWWIEWGARNNTIADDETIRRELQAAVFGVWDHIKNHCTKPGVRERAATWAIDWIGHLPGKRESRRFEGDYIMRESDVVNGISSVPHDVVAFGGWPIDLHAADGIYSPEPPCTQPPIPDRYGIPLRSLYSRTVSNLFLAGRNISQSHVAHASTRVMKTCAVIGEGVGIAASVATATGQTPRQLTQNPEALNTIQQRILRGGAYLPTLHNTDDRDLVRSTNNTVTASSEAKLRSALIPDPEAAWEIYGLSDVEPGVLRAFQQKHPHGKLISVDRSTAQAVVVSSGKLDSITLDLSNSSDAPVKAVLHVHQARHLRDFGDPHNDDQALASIEAEVHPGNSSVTFTPSQPIACEPGAPVTLRLGATDSLGWRLTIQEPPGTQAGQWDEELGYWRWIHGTLGFDISPVSMPFGAENIKSGMTRPEVNTNLWISDPDQNFPQHICISWDDEVVIDHVETTFDSQLSGWIWEGSFPLVARDYTIETQDSETGAWIKQCSITGNSLRRRVHTFAPTSTKSLRVTIVATNGGPTARIIEIRAYHEEGG